MNRHHEEEILTKYYLAQIGHGSELYRGQLYQKGTIVCDEGGRERESCGPRNCKRKLKL